MYIEENRVPIDLPNGKTVLANIEVTSPKLIYYGNYFIELRTAYNERKDLEDMYEYIKNCDYVHEMTEIYDMLDEGKLFDYVMNNDLRKLFHYIMDIPSDNDHITDLVIISLLIKTIL